MTIETWHGLTHKQWAQVWADKGWRANAKITLIEIATSPYASTKMRIKAIQTYANACAYDVLPTDSGMAEFMIDQLLEMSTGAAARRAEKAAGSTRLKRRRARELRDRLRAVYMMIHVAGHFLRNAAVEEAVQDDEPLAS